MSLAIDKYFLIFLPALIFYIIICIKDRGDRETVGLLSLLVFSGAAAAVPVFFGERKLQSIADRLFQSFYKVDVNGRAIFETFGHKMLHALLCSFVCAALVEVIVKWLLLFVITNKNRQYTSFFDGIFYSTNISVGFCIADCIIRSVIEGWDTFFVRLLLALPGAFFISIVSGLFYSLWHTYSAVAAVEKKFIEENGIENKKPVRYRFWLVLSIVMTIALRGLDIFTQMIERTSFDIVFYVFVAAFYIFAFITVFKMKKGENLEEEVIDRVLSEKYPGTN